ncbi:MAG: serine hydrolase [Acidobacteriota bacterium]
MTESTRLSLLLALTVALLSTACGTPSTDPMDERFAPLQAAMDRALELEEIPQIAVLVTDREGTLWSMQRGSSDLGGDQAPKEGALFRVGSVSKLFTDLAVMKLVEPNQLDLDAPVTKYLPDFLPESNWETPMTLRQLMAHRSGLLREPPVGHYFDDTGPSLQQTVDALAETALVAEPGTLTKYSNAGIAVVGRVLEAISGQPFEQAVTELVLAPLEMSSSSFSTPLDDALVPEAAMWTMIGRTFPAPDFPLGMAPAGSLYTSLEDLGLFIRALLRPEGIVSDESLAEMLTPQFAPEGATEGFGLGFRVDTFEGERRIGHGGAIYGFATQLAVLPESGLGVTVVATKDFGNAAATRLADLALRLALDERAEAPEPEQLLDEAERDRLVGRYSDGERALEIKRRGDRLWLFGAPFPAEVRRRGEELVLTGLTGDGSVLVAAEGDPAASIVVDERTLQRSDEEPAAAPERFRDVIGEYGWDHNVLVILERDGRLEAVVEWFEQSPLTEIAADVYAFPERRGWLYHHETLRFERDAQGAVQAAVLGAVRFPRRQIGSLDGETFRIEPQRPIGELRQVAAAASPPAEAGEFLPSDLVELRELIPDVRLDVRYATTNNFMGAEFYLQPRAFLQRPAAEALARVQQSLADRGWGLLVYDGYRPWRVTKMFWDATPESQRVFVANPANGSRHNRGCAVDLTLVDLPTGQPLAMTGGYDEFSDRSYPDYPGGTSLERWHREQLRAAMKAEGFTVYEAEWWHFDYAAWRDYGLQNDAFENLEGSPSD